MFDKTFSYAKACMRIQLGSLETNRVRSFLEKKDPIFLKCNKCINRLYHYVDGDCSTLVPEEGKE